MYSALIASLRRGTARGGGVLRVSRYLRIFVSYYILLCIIFMLIRYYILLYMSMSYYVLFNLIMSAYI